MRHAGRSVRVAVLATLTGCYTYVPLETAAPPVGESVALEITDQGRVSLGERFGPGVMRIEGRLTGTEGDQLLINVSRVANIRGEAAQWSGESVRLDRDFVGRLQERRLSKGRTWLAAGLTTAAIVALIATRGIYGFGSSPEPTEPPPPPTSMVRGFRIAF